MKKWFVRTMMAFCMVVSFPALAQNDPGAEKAYKTWQHILGEYGMPTDFLGVQPVVTGQGGQYQIVYPARKIKAVEIGEIRVRAEIVNETHISYDVQLPNELMITAPNKAGEFVRMKIGQHLISGLWAIKNNRFLQSEIVLKDLEAAFDGVVSTGNRLKMDMKTGDLSYARFLTPKSDDSWSMENQFSTQNLMFSFYESNGEYVDMFVGWLNYRDQLQDMNKAVMDKALEIFLGESEDPFTPLVGFFAGLPNGIGTMAKDGMVELEAQNVIVKALTEAHNTPGEVSFDSFNLSAMAGDLDQPKSMLAFRFGFSGFDLVVDGAAPWADIPDAFIVRNMNFDMEQQNVPLKDNLAIWAKHLSKPQPAGTTDLNTMMMEMGALSERAGEKTVIHDFSIGNDLFGIAGTGWGMMKNQKPYGEFALRVGDFNQASTALQQTPAPQQTFAMMNMVQMMGQQSETAGYRDYVFQALDTGQILMNGTDVKQLMGGFMQGRPQ